MSARPVLLIDDDATWCERVCHFLAAHGIETFAVRDEAAAIQLLPRIVQPGAVLVEPATIDPVFIDVLRELPALAGVPLFFMSSSPAGRVFNRSTGVSGYVRKDVAFEHLMFLLDDAIRAAGEHGVSLVTA
jgi:DNA-binding response OmpR family regulator